jgi:hypothetical protein
MPGYLPVPGDLAVCRVPSRWSRPIELLEWCNGDGFTGADHAFALLPDGLIFECAPWKARIRPLAGCEYEDIVWSGPRFNPTAEQRAKVIETARWLVERPGGTPYSGLDYLALSARRLHIPAPHLRAFIKNSGHMLCSQGTDFLALSAGWHLFDDGRWEGDVTPADERHLFLGEPVT